MKYTFSLLSYGQLSLRRTPFEQALSVRLRDDVRLIENQKKGVKKGRDRHKLSVLQGCLSTVFLALQF